MLNDEELKTKDKLSWGGYTFLLMFAPPIIPHINMILLLGLFSFAYLAINWNRIDLTKLKKMGIVGFLHKYYFFLLYALFVFFFYLLFDGRLQEITISDIYRYLILLPVEFICVFLLLIKAEEKNWNIINFSEIFIIGGIYQFFLVLLAFIFPPVKNLFIKVMSENTGQAVYFNTTLQSQGSEVRYFGFASTLIDNFGYCIGLLCALSMFIGFFYKKRFLGYVPLLLFTTLLNSRTGLLMFVVALLLFLVGALVDNNLEAFATIFFSLFVFVVLFLITFAIISVSAPETLNWISSGFINLLNTVFGKTSQNFDVGDVLFSKKFWTFPSGFAFFFGSGFDVVNAGKYLSMHSDVGYVNQIWTFGLVGTILLYIPFVSVMVKAFKNNPTLLRVLLVTFTILFFLIMIKFDVITYNPGSPVFLSIILFLMKEGNHLRAES